MLSLRSGIRAVVLAAASIGFSGSALAYDWSGIYFGGHLGGGWGEVEYSDDYEILPRGGVPQSFFSDRAAYDVDGFVGGVQLGMNKQFGNLVVGGEIDLSGANISGSSTNDCFGALAPLNLVGSRTEVCSTDVNWLVSGRMRLGYSVGRWLAYGTAGWSLAGVDTMLTLTDITGIRRTSISNQTADGMMFGGGLEYGLWDGMTLGVEYIRMNLSSKADSLVSEVFRGDVTGVSQYDVDLDIVRAKLNIRWGG